MAFRYALSIAQHYRGKLFVQHVVESWQHPEAAFVPGHYYLEFQSRLLHKGEDEVQRFVKHHASNGIQPEPVIEQGIAADSILALAEAQNVRRRAQQDVERERKFGIERFAKDILSVADNLGRALSVLPDDTDAIDPALRNVIVGVQATERELQSVLERHGIKRVESLGRPFNAEFHQAMMEIEDPTVPAGTVVQELAPGYLIAGRLLRAAMVAVSKGGPAVRSPSNEN